LLQQDIGALMPCGIPALHCMPESLYA
jgi:hypothetical protein